MPSRVIVERSVGTVLFLLFLSSVSFFLAFLFQNKSRRNGNNIRNSAPALPFRDSSTSTSTFLCRGVPLDATKISSIAYDQWWRNSGGGSLFYTPTIPSCLGQLTELTELVLDRHDTSWGRTSYLPIPTELGLLTKLTLLALSGNQWTGTFPSVLSKLTSLQVLEVSEAPFIEGTLPSELGTSLTDLRTMRVFLNPRLTGTIPTELGQLSQLTELRMYGNGLTGTLPTEFGAALETLDLFENMFLTGSTLPSEYGRLSNLKSLSLGGNGFSGTIPTEYGQLSALTGLLLLQNSLAGTIPSELGLLGASLRDLDLADNHLSGTIPVELGSLTALTSLWLLNNRLTGSVPTGLRELSGLVVLAVQGNPLFT